MVDSELDLVLDITLDLSMFRLICPVLARSVIESISRRIPSNRSDWGEIGAHQEMYSVFMKSARYVTVSTSETLACFFPVWQ